MKGLEEPRKVHFDEERNVIHPHIGDGEVNCAEDELTHIEAVASYKESMRECVCNWACTEYWKLMEEVVDDEDGEAKDVQKYITAYARIEVDGDIPRGLERSLSQAHYDARRALVDKATYAVLSADYKLRCETPDITEEEIWKELRNIYKKHSQGAKNFARKMGKADESAARREPLGEKQALELIGELQERSKAGDLRVKRRPSNERRSSRTPKNLESFENEFAEAASSKQDKPRKVPFSVSSFYSSSRSKAEKTSVDDSSSELFVDVDKKGKTRMSWKGLKKRLSSTMGAQTDVRMH